MRKTFLFCVSILMALSMLVGSADAAPPIGITLHRKTEVPKLNYIPPGSKKKPWVMVDPKKKTRFDYLQEQVEALKKEELEKEQLEKAAAEKEKATDPAIGKVGGVGSVGGIGPVGPNTPKAGK